MWFTGLAIFKIDILIKNVIAVLIIFQLLDLQNELIEGAFGEQQ